MLREAANERVPFKITTWVRKLAGQFHSFYHDFKVISQDLDPQLIQSRLYLVEATRIGLGVGLDLLGVSAPEEM